MGLEILWAGWRAAYVATAADVPEGEGSVFTRILASGLPDADTHVLWRGPTCFAICNAFPYVSGHLLVTRSPRVRHGTGPCNLLRPDQRLFRWNHA